MKLRILKRLEGLEKQLYRQEENPLIVTMSHEAYGWRIGETYTSRQRSFRVKALREYVITPAMKDTTFIVDDLERSGLFSFNGYELLEIARTEDVVIEGLEALRGESMGYLEFQEVNR